MKSMKKSLTFAFVLVALMCLLVLSASAYSGTEYGDTGIYYKVINGEVTITDTKSNIKTADIPKSIDGYPVTSIGNYSFRGRAGLLSITIPDSVTSIGDNAFKDCIGLQKINWNAENVEDFAEKNTVFTNVGTSGDGISVVFGDNVKSIPSYSFYSPYISYVSPKIKAVTIGNGVTSIGNYSFRDCAELTSVTIPDGVSSIGNSTFRGCTSLSSVTISDNVTNIGPDAFNNTVWYDSQPYGDVYAGSVYYKYKGTMLSNTSITIKDGTKGIAGSAFSGCTGLTNITIPNSVTIIGDSAFRECKGLINITIPDSVTSIGDDAFNYCRRLTSIVIPDSVTRIGRSAFSGCDGLTSITIPNSVKSIGKYAFSTFYSANVYISDLAAWCNIDFKGIISTYNYRLYLNGNRITNLVIPDGVTSVSAYAFSGCSGLTRITIPNGVTDIGEYAFSGCPFAEIKIGKDLKSIGKNAFNGIKVIPELYYAGSEEEWSKIPLDSTNEFIQRANMHYNSDISHTHSYTETVTKIVTCTVDGLKRLTCDCGNSYTEVITATGHKAVTDMEIPATCTENGKTAGLHCSVCGEVLVAQKATKALGHKNKTTVTAATTSKDGKIVTACTVCKTVSKTTVISKASSVKLAKTSYTYNGKAQKPKVTVKDSKGKLLTEGKDYTVKYQSGRKNPGKYTVTVTFKGNYSGKKTLTFTIAPKAPTLKVSAAKKSVKLSWNKQAGATGYTVYMATSKNGKYKKIATVKGNRNVKFTKTGLTKGKTYYFKVAAYTTSGGKTIPGAYSTVKSVKAK